MQKGDLENGRKRMSLHIDVGLRRPGIALIKTWWDQRCERPRCRVALAMADPVVPDSVKNVKSIPIKRHIKYLKQYLKAHSAQLFHPKLDFILIEQQPSRGSKCIVVISYVMYAIIEQMYLEHNPHRKYNPPKVDFASSTLKTKHIASCKTKTRPMRKKAVFEDMMKYLREQGPKEVALAGKLRRHTAKFDICDAIAQGVAWFSIHVKRAKRRPFLGSTTMFTVDTDEEEEDVKDETTNYRANTWSDEDSERPEESSCSDEEEPRVRAAPRRKRRWVEATPMALVGGRPATATLTPVPFSALSISLPVQVNEYIS